MSSLADKILQEGFIVLSKSNCHHCTYVKMELEDNDQDYTEINCDSFLEDSATKQKFLTTVAELIGSSYKTFPMVFYDGKFIGGLNDTRDYLFTHP